ncbi:MAG: nicotinamide riboside transporter PnuC [Chitinophagaceae bacterium]|nr:nicotinamide riboside transporter PnuC [Chitinophagaceae bacterium]
MDSFLEVTAIVSGLASVWLSRRESVLTYPVGLINTAFYTYLSFKYHLPGESAVNFYYTVMSLYGWYMWALKNDRQEKVLHITFSDKKMWITQILFFAVIYVVVFVAIISLKNLFWEGAIPAADAFATATAFTGMWLMTRKKVESWYWWIATNTASIPLYYVKGLELTAGYYLILLVFAFWGLATWKKKAHVA